VKQDWRTLSINVTADFLLSLVINEAQTFNMFFAGQQRTFSIDGFFPTALLPLSQLYVPLIPISRNFFQYRSFTAAFSPGTVISNISASPIVSNFTHNPQRNTITVYFHPYDAPYTGSVISFDVNGERRFIRIEGTEN
jgi:fluoride ion exporter CrcB/FEX